MGDDEEGGVNGGDAREDLDFRFVEDFWNLRVMKCALLSVLTFLGLIQFAGADVQVSGAAYSPAAADKRS
jgi:hypothetical protein